MIKFSLTNVKLCPINRRKQPGVFKKNGRVIPYAYTSSEYKKCKQMLVDHFIENVTLEEVEKLDQKNVKVVMSFTMYKDIDSCEKIILDALEESKVIDNDRYVFMVIKIKTPAKRGAPEEVDIIVC